VGEEVALWRILREAEASASEGEFQGYLDRLPTHPVDLNFEDLRDALYQDHDFLMLDDPSHDGIEDADDPDNRYLGIGDNLVPQNWFKTFLNMPERDPRRGFRR
jgi:hypothetical protein